MYLVGFIVRKLVTIHDHINVKHTVVTHSGVQRQSECIQNTLHLPYM
jgi:hypothetical protein